MGPETQQILTEVTSRASGDLILFFVLLLVALVIFFLPLYAMIQTDRKTTADKTIARERLIIDVVTANTGAITGLRHCLESSQAATQATLGRIYDAVAADGPGHKE